MDIAEANARFAEIKAALSRWTAQDRESGIDRSASELKAIFEDIESRVLIELNSLYTLLTEDSFRIRHKLQAQGMPKLEAAKAAEKEFPLLQEHVEPTLEKTESRVAVVRDHIGKLKTLRDKITRFVENAGNTLDTVHERCPSEIKATIDRWKGIAADLACWAQDTPIDYWLYMRDNRSFLWGSRNRRTIDSALEDDFNQILLELRLLPQGTAGDIAKPLENERDSLVTHIEDLRIPPPTIALIPADPPPRRVDDDGRDSCGKRPVDLLVDEIAALLAVPTYCRIACEKVAKLRNDHLDLMRWGVDRLRCPNSARLGLQAGASWPPPEKILMLFWYGLIVAVHDFNQESREKRLHFDKNQGGGAAETDFDLAACQAAEYAADENTAFRDSVYEALKRVRGDLSPPVVQTSDDTQEAILRGIKEGREVILEAVQATKRESGSADTTDEQVETETPADAGEEKSKEVPWDDSNKDYMTASEAVDMAEKLNRKISPPKLSLLLSSVDCPIHFMRKGQRARVHIAEFKVYMDTLPKIKITGEDISDEATAEYFEEVEAAKAEAEAKRLKELGRDLE